jgi:hypothetical protein
MFSTVHRTSVFATVLCALFFLSVAPLVVRSQEDIKTQSSEQFGTSTTTTLASATSTVVADTAPASLIGLYPSEGVPGGGEAIGDFVVGPGKLDLTIAPGESKTVEMTVTNRTGVRRRFNISSEDAQGSKDPNTAITLLGDDRGPYSMKDFISIPHMSFELDHNQRARIPVTITIPANADPGGLYGSVLVNTIAVEAVEGDTSGTAPQSAIIARIGTLFFITIPGPTKKEGTLKDFMTVPKKSFYQNSPISFGILYENTGSIHLAPYGELRIRNMFNEEVGYVQLDPWFVLPQALRLREVSWNRDFLFGRYTATVSVNRSYDDVVDEKSYSFWVLPWKPVSGIFAALFLVFFLIRTFLKRFEFKRK